jgi:hypothetical protein
MKKETKYCCPIHKEIQGNLNDMCSVCGSLLTVVVSEIVFFLNPMNFIRFLKSCLIK